MAVIHNTTLTPGKLELLAAWIPGQPWYLGEGREPELAKAGGFRLDDPSGEVGIEFMAVTDASGPQPTTYLVPLSYRGAPLGGADKALIGTAEHGVTGRRWIYDGIHDPVLVAQLLALLLGETAAQHQNVSDVADPSVTSTFTGSGLSARTAPTAVTNGPQATDLLVPTATAPGSPTGRAGHLTVRLNRILTADPDGASTSAANDLGQVTADWLLPDGTTARAPIVTVHAQP